MVHPSWAPLEFLTKDSSLIIYPSFINAFWKAISSYNPISSYDKKIADLMDNIVSWIEANDKNENLGKGTLDLKSFIDCYRSIFNNADSSPLDSVRRVLNTIPAEHSQYRSSLGIQLIKKLNSPSRKGSDWESLLGVIHSTDPRVIFTLLDKERMLLREFPTVFWLGLVRLAVSHGTALPAELRNLIKQSIKSLPEMKLQELIDKVRDKPDLLAYIKAPSQESLFKRVFGMFKKIEK